MLGMHHKTGRRWNGTDLAALLGARTSTFPGLLFLLCQFNDAWPESPPREG